MEATTRLHANTAPSSATPTIFSAIPEFADVLIPAVLIVCRSSPLDPSSTTMRN